MQIKPPYGVRLSRGHPLTRGLVGAWLFHEGRGDTLWDASGCGHIGTLMGMDPTSGWIAGPHGPALDFDGVNDRVVVAAPAGIDLGTANACVIRCRLWPASWDILVGDQGLSNLGYLLALNGAALQYQAGSSAVSVGHGIAAGDEVWLGVSREGQLVTFYKNGLRLGNPQYLSANNALAVSAIGAFYAGGGPTTMRCDYVYCWRRALSASEMACLYRRPFCFAGRSIVLPIIPALQGTTRDVAGSAGATSSAGAAATIIHASHRPTGRPWASVTLGIEPAWLREALLHGTTDVAFRLGTVLTQGWFWMRRAGASAMYRRENPPSAIRNPRLVAVVSADAEQVALPAYLPHEAGSSCDYIVRRFNACGQQDRTTHAATRVTVAEDGRLAAPAPNASFALQVTRAQVNTQDLASVQWFYWLVDQGTAPQVFHVYWDAGTGEVDYIHPLASVPYEGRKFYRCQSPPLQEGTYRFVVQAASAVGAQGPARECEIQIANATTSQGPDAVGAEAI
ncbi:MAG: hypothetical protein JW955_17960 [Sedimentisphaerales bacterium]|nr:hypothetical protein [Sedimentisphaerales bacterium]